jgi:predicted Rossmann fold flavoprotein
MCWSILKINKNKGAPPSGGDKKSNLGVSFMIYDLIIIGAGAAGLFAGASLPSPVSGLILEKKAAPGRKLLMTGSGQCNLTHGGSIKDFITHYGNNGAKIRPVLYRFNNLAVADFFEQRGVPLTEREDGKVFPASLKAKDVLNVLTDCCKKNGLQFQFSTAPDRITFQQDVYTVHCGERAYQARKVIAATGGCSYPATGSDGSFFSVLRDIGIEIAPLAPALVPVFTELYPYESLSGISFQDAEVSVNSVKNRDALLLTHTCFSGPAVLNISRLARPGDTVVFNYYPAKPEEIVVRELSALMTGNGKQLLTVLNEYFNRDASGLSSEMPKRFLETVCRRAGIDAAEKASRISPALLKSAVRLIVRDEYKILKLGGYESAMVTSGGVVLSEIDLKIMESIKYPGLYFAGEVLDVDGDTGGYNLQFAFSSGSLAAGSAVNP